LFRLSTYAVSRFNCMVTAKAYTRTYLETFISHGTSAQMPGEFKRQSRPARANG
jgi:hypothetical protein